jgi:hypothetical protein
VSCKAREFGNSMLSWLLQTD